METYDGEVEVRFLDSSVEPHSFTREQITPAFLNEHCVAVSYVPLLVEDETGALPEVAAEALAVGRVIGALEDEGFTTQYFLQAGNVGPTGITDTRINNFVFDPHAAGQILRGAEHALPHIGHGIVWVYDHIRGPADVAEKAVEAVSATSETVELGVKAVEKFRGESVKPKRGGDVADACTAARLKLAQVLGIGADAGGLKPTSASATRPNGTFTCDYRYRRAAYTVTSVYAGKGKYAVVLIKELRPA